MKTSELFEKLRDGEISRFDALNTVLTLTQKEPERINIFIDEVDYYVFNEKEDINNDIIVLLGYYFDDKLTKDEIFKEVVTDLDIKLTNGDALYEFDEFDVLDICEAKNFKSWGDLPTRTVNSVNTESEFSKKHGDSFDFPFSFESLFYPYEFYPFYQLKRDLAKYLTPHQTTIQQNNKPKAKDVWRLAARYELLRDLGIIDKLRTSVELIKDRQKILMQILGINEDTAKKLLEGSYKQSETQTDQLERKQLIAYIKQPPTD